MRLLAFLVLALGCSTGTPMANGADPSTVDASANPDAETPADAAPGTPDATDVDSTPDANTTPDADTTPDASPPIDAAPTPDASTPDAAPPADANNCPTSPCDLFEQCGCTPPLVCDVNGADLLGGNACRAVSVAGTETSTCGGFDECAGGYVCVNAGSDASCKPYCQDDNDCDSPRGQCVIQLSSGGTEIPGAIVCSSNCDPTSLIPAGCPATWGCSLFTIDPDGQAGTGDESDIADCTPAGAGGQNDPCLGDIDCAPGFLCIDAGGLTPECLRICDTVGSACTANPLLDCFGFVDPHQIAGVEYGVCF